jgi:hypothetical protein
MYTSEIKHKTPGKFGMLIGKVQSLFNPPTNTEWATVLVPHSHCSLRENPKFCKILDLKITYLKKIFEYYFSFISAIVIQAWHSEVKTSQNCIYFLRENSQNLRQKCSERLNEPPVPGSITSK